MRALLILVYLEYLGYMGNMDNLEAENEQQFWWEVEERDGSITVFPIY